MFHDLDGDARYGRSVGCTMDDDVAGFGVDEGDEVLVALSGNGVNWAAYVRGDVFARLVFVVSGMVRGSFQFGECACAACYVCRWFVCVWCKGRKHGMFAHFTDGGWVGVGHLEMKIMTGVRWG